MVLLLPLLPSLWLRSLNSMAVGKWYEHTAAMAMRSSNGQTRRHEGCRERWRDMSRSVDLLSTLAMQAEGSHTTSPCQCNLRSVPV